MAFKSRISKQQQSKEKVEIQQNSELSITDTNLLEKLKIKDKGFVQQSIDVINFLEKQHNIFLYDVDRYPGMYLKGFNSAQNTMDKKKIFDSLVLKENKSNKNEIISFLTANK